MKSLRWLLPASLILFVGLIGLGCGSSSSTPTTTTTTTTLVSGVVWNLATEHATFPVCGKHTSLVFDNKMWVIGGWPSIEGGYFPTPRQDVWSSTDGITWTQTTAEAAFNKRCLHSSVVFNNKMWVIGGATMSGNTNDVWSSTDGITWTLATAEAPFSARSGQASLVFDSKMWVIGGEDDAACKNDIWSSTDGINWVQATAGAGFSARKNLVSLEFNGAMWVIGGEDDTAPKNDVWYSTNGAAWTQATASAEFGARTKFAGTVHNNKIWLIGGTNADPTTTGNNDVWFSANGLNWTQATAEAAFGHRSSHTCVTYNNKIWVIGGGTDLYSSGGAAFYVNDVWWSN